MIYNANLIITNRCNSRCTNCQIWQFQENLIELNPNQLKRIFLLPELKGLTDLGVSGGEPFLKEDLLECMKTIFSANNNINNIFITTNGSRIKETLLFCELMTQMKKNLQIGVSIDGDRDTNRSIRGVDNLDCCILLIRSIRKEFPNIHVSISTTICKKNCNEKNLEFIRNISNQLMCDYTFRVADVAESYYKNGEFDNSLSDNQMTLVVDHIIKYKFDDPFMKESLIYYLTKKVPLLFDYENNRVKCRAGERFVFIQSDGAIYPCLYSKQCIGDISGFKMDFILEPMSKCPCCTECTVWPVIIDINRLSNKVRGIDHEKM